MSLVYQVTVFQEMFQPNIFLHSTEYFSTPLPLFPGSLVDIATGYGLDGPGIELAASVV
jgi:hypothetical protein